MQLLCSRTCSAQPASHSLVGWSTLRPRLTRHPASPRPHAANEENAALRKAIEDADYECGVGLLRLNQLDLVTVVASPATVRRSATVPSPQEQLISQSGLPQCVRRPFTGPEEEQLCLQHCPWTTTQPGRGQRLAGGDDKHSQPNAKLANGQQVCMRCARPSTRRRAGPRAPETGAAQRDYKSSRHGTAPPARTVGGATNTVRSPPSLLIELLNGV